MKGITLRKNDLLTDLSENFNRLLSSFENSPDFQSAQLATMNWTPKIDVKEQDNQYIIYADIPGIEPSKIDVNVENGILTIKGHKESEKKEEKENYLRIERSSGSFIRQMSLPESIDSTKVKAKSKNGVLQIILPKSQKGPSHKITVEKE